MLFEWDEAKDAANRAKHGIGFDEAAEIFAGPVLTEPSPRDHADEARFISIGQGRRGLIVTVVHVDRSGVMRIISARPASRAERRRFHGTYGPRQT